MKPVYQRENLKITEFDAEDVISTSGSLPEINTEPTTVLSEESEKENAHTDISGLDGSGGWF